MYGSTGTGISENTQESEQLRPGKCRRQRTHLGLCPGRELGSLDWLGLGRVGHAWLTWDWAFIEHLGTWVAWAWEVHEIHGPSVTVPSWSRAWVVGSKKCTSPWTLADPGLSIHYKGSPKTPEVFVCSVPASPQHNRESDPDKSLLSLFPIRA